MAHQMKEASQRRRALSYMTTLRCSRMFGCSLYRALSVQICIMMIRTFESESHRFRVAMMEDWEWTCYKELSIIHTLSHLRHATLHVRLVILWELP